MSDDAFHEIQLNGKQLVFLFMVAIVVSSVIFLCGVLVGRGVRNERTLAAEVQQLQETPTPDDVSAPPAPPATADPTTAPPPSTVNDSAFAEKLDRPGKTDQLKSPPPMEAKALPPAPPPAAKAPEPAAATPVPPVAKTAAASPGPGEGFVVQVAALVDRKEAERIVKRLTGKGYSAYVISPTAGTPQYRVRVGSFKTRGEANTVADKLAKEERVVKPWVTQ